MLNPDQKKKIADLTPEEVWYIYLMEGPHALQQRAPLMFRTFLRLEHSTLKILPAEPRCIFCNAPFRGMGEPFMRLLGKQQSKYNPSICNGCERFVHKHTAGAEVELTMLFADIRGSTPLAEELGTAAFTQLINRFYTVSTDQLIRHHAMIDKLVGDEVTAFFVPGISGKEHTRQAINAAQALLQATGHHDPDGPWAPVGIGIHSGSAYVGVVGSQGGLTDITVLGDVANTAARLASLAKAGEIILSDTSAQTARLDTSGLQHKELELKGKSEALPTWTLPASPEPIGYN